MLVRRLAILPILLLLLPALASPPPALAEDPDEPKLEGEAKKAHDRAVKALVKKLRKYKSNELLHAHIARLGRDASRASRDALIKFVIGNKNQATANEVFRALAKVGDRTSLAFLSGKHALRSRSFLIQETAVNALGETEDPRAAAALVEVMRGRRTKEAVIEACGYALGRCGPRQENATKALLDFSKHTKSSIRIACLGSLGKTGCDAAYERLVQALEKDTNTGARGAAAYGLGLLGRAAALPHLKAALKREGATTVRDRIIAAIAAVD